MSTFRILNSNNEIIPINDLDKEAAAFWNKEVKPRYYANPTPEFTNPDNLQGIELTKAQIKHGFNESINWFDSIGWQIANPSVKYTTGWDNIKCCLLSIHTESLALSTIEEQIIILKSANEYVQPYFDLIDHWVSKGYIPVKN